MRLISMSTHARLREQGPFMKNYQNEIECLFLSLYSFYRKKITRLHPFLNPPAQGKTLLILIGSQKGLCGNFNEGLFAKFKKEFWHLNQSTHDIIAIGKKATDFLLAQKVSPIKSFDAISSTKISLFAHELTQYIATQKPAYAHVKIISNYAKTFFSHTQQITTLIPFDLPCGSTGSIDIRDYVWEHDPIELLEHLAQLHMNTSLEHVIFNSLLSEQAARFVSMDSSTRNAQEVLDTMKLQYNKLRQTKITKELTELSSCFQINSKS